MRLVSQTRGENGDGGRVEAGVFPERGAWRWTGGFLPRRTLAAWKFCWTFWLTLLRCRTLLVGKTGLEQAKKLIVDYKTGRIREMTPELWKAKKIVDSTLHPGMEAILGTST